MSNKQISAVVGALVTVAGALGVGGYSLGGASVADRISAIETRVEENGKGIARIEGYLTAKSEPATK